MNASLITADLSTHIRIVLIALLAAMVVVWAGATSRLTRTGAPRQHVVGDRRVRPHRTCPEAQGGRRFQSTTQHGS